ncbi:ATP-binding protein [Sphingomonas sp. 3-13AW]|uniref:ATP-binding protein n=1 Tax=Sphingomonas sp. 3-13AW TaxID=3050450 RepID=UPI003BB622E9
MSILLGTSMVAAGGRREAVSWIPEKAINGHSLVVGSSGMGKTHRLRKLIEGVVSSYGARVHIIDVHGDITIPGEQDALFSESSPYGLNPLKINPDRYSGGVNKRIRAFGSMLSRTSQTLGPRQSAALTRLLEDLYRRNGFDANDWRTWNPLTNPNVRGRSLHHGVYPNISDLKKFTAYKLKELKTGAGGEANTALNELNKVARAMHKKALKSHGTEDEGLDPALDKAVLKAIETYTKYVRAVRTGDELNDLLRYTSAEVLETVLDRIDILDKSGIFKDAPPPLDEMAAVHRYNIKALGRDEQKMFVEILLDEIWQAAKARGQTDVPNNYIVIDEASIFLDKDPDHIINILMRESRKFGIGLMFASQSLNHFSDDVLANVGLKIVLGVDQMYISQMSRMLRVDGRLIENIRPRRTALVQCKIVGDQRNDFTEIFLA